MKISRIELIKNRKPMPLPGTDLEGLSQMSEAVEMYIAGVANTAPTSTS